MIKLPEVVTAVVGFVHAVRAAGMRADHSRLDACIEAVACVDRSNVEQVYWAMRLTLCGSPSDFVIFDAVFDDWFRRGNLAPGADTAAEETISGVDGKTASQDGLTSDLSNLPGAYTAASDAEVLRTRDVDRLNEAEREEVNRMISLLTPCTTTRPRRRSGSHRRGQLDLARIVAQMLQDGGELSAVHFRRRRIRPRRLVFFVDVSGSMGWYADFLLRFAHAAVQAAPYSTEVFTIGTRLSRITNELRIADADCALAKASETSLDWSGGTRLGETLRSFLRGPQQACVRGSVVLLATDGGESGRAELLSHQLVRLECLARTLIWINPLADLPPTAVRTPASRLLAAHANSVVAGNTLSALVELTHMIAGRYDNGGESTRRASYSNVR